MSKSGNGRPCRLRGSLGRESEGRRKLKRWSASVCLVGNRQWRKVEGLDCGKLGCIKSSDWSGVNYPKSFSDRCSFQLSRARCLFVFEPICYDLIAIALSNSIRSLLNLPPARRDALQFLSSQIFEDSSIIHLPPSVALLRPRTRSLSMLFRTGCAC